MASKAAFIVSLLIPWVTAQDCVAGPLSFPLGNLTLSNGKTQRGISLKVGNPPQEYAFLPKWDINNTFLYCSSYPSSKSGLTEKAYFTYRGGIYEDDKSDSRGKLAASVKLPPDLWNETTYDVFTETVGLGGDNLLKAFPLGRQKNGTSWDTQRYDPMNILGMGKNSTFVDACRTAGRITSDSMGFYWGLDGVQDKDQSKGSFVLGGFDKAKTYGDGRTRPLSDSRTDCGTRMMVSIKDMVLNFANGTNYSIFEKQNGGTLLEACIVPEIPVVMNLPYRPFSQTLLSAISNEEWDRSLGIDYWNLVLNPAKPMFTGDLTITLDDGFQVKIPNHQLVVPERYIDHDGELTTNSSRPVLRINSLQSQTGLSLPVLGRYFFTGAYLFLNRDAQQFTLWNANPTSDENLMAVNKKATTAATQSCTTPPNTSLQPSQASKQDGKDDIDNHSSLSSGAIAGIAIGAAIVAGLSFGLIWYFVRKRKTNAQVAGDDAREGQGQPPASKETDPGWPSQGYPHYVPQEMSSQSRPAELGS